MQRQDNDKVKMHRISDTRLDSNYRKMSAKRRRSQEDRDENLTLTEFSNTDGKGENYELYVDEVAQKKEQLLIQKQAEKLDKKNKTKKPMTPLKHKIIRIISYCIVLAVVLITGVVLSLTVLFKTQEYSVSGCDKYDKADIITTCGISKNENIFLANKSAAEKRLKEKFAYIEDVDVSFAIPDKITINITQAVPSYLVKVSDKQYLVVSTKGRILSKTDKSTSYNLPLFLGSGVTSTDVGAYINYSDSKVFDIINDIVTVFADNGYKGITQIDATDTAKISFTYDGRIKVKIGVPEDISYKVRTAMTIINEKLDMNGSKSTKGELDVSTCNSTKKSYFREQSLIDAQQNVAETVKPTESVQDEDTDTQSDEYDGDSTDEEQQEATEKKLSVDEWYVD